MASQKMQRNCLASVVRVAGAELRREEVMSSHRVDPVKVSCWMSQERDGRNVLTEGLTVPNQTGGCRTCVGWRSTSKVRPKARPTEMQFFEDTHFIDIKWIATNNGDTTVPMFRSRLDGREYILRQTDHIHNVILL